MRYTLDEEVSLLRKYASLARYGIVEIGVLDGDTTKELAKASRVPVYGVDPLVPDSMSKKIVGSEESIRSNMWAFRFRFLFFKDYSYNVVKTFTYPFDFIFIDGNHYYTHVKRDFKDWYPKLAIPGYILFHDSVRGFPCWPGPIRFTEELEAKGYKVIEQVKTIKVFVK